MTEDERQDIKRRFHATLGLQEAIDELRRFATTAEGRDKIAAASAMLDLRSGRSMQSTMARFRRDLGADPAKP